MPPLAVAAAMLVAAAGALTMTSAYRLPFSVVLLLVLLVLRERRRTAERERALVAANLALAHAEASFRGIFESATDALCTCRIAGDGTIRLDKLNPAAARLRALDETACGKRLEELLPADAAAQARRDIEAVAASGRSLRSEWKLRRDRLDAEVIITPLPGSEAATDRVFVSIRDITHLRRAQAAMARSEALYRTIAESTSDLILRLDVPELRIAYVSPASRALLGVEPDAVIGQGALDAVHPKDRTSVEAALAAQAAGSLAGPPRPIAYRIRRGDGCWLWVEASMSASRDPSGTVDGLICSIRDIDARRRAEAARAASEARFRLLAENTSELIVLSHDDGRRSYISPASLRLVGFTPAELQGEMDARRWAHPDDVGQLARTELLQGADTAVSCRVRRRDGAWIWVEAIVRRIPASIEGEPTIIATFRDITERQAQAQALREAKDAADAARRTAEQASRAKSEFLATMSHEIRTPLNAILGFAELLEPEAPLRPDRRPYRAPTPHAGSALRTIVDDILDFSRFEAGETQLELLPFRPAALIEDATAIVRGLAERKGLDLTVSLDPALPWALVGDYARIRQILINLLNNAIKFTRQGSIALAVAARADDAGGAGQDGAPESHAGKDHAGKGQAWLRFAVSDTGIGIPADKLERVFQRFSQVDGSVSREYGGTGLGLAICRSLVEAMGGRIDVESAVERGSTFWFELTLPVAQSVDLDEAAIEGGRACERLPSADSAASELFDELAAMVELPRPSDPPAGDPPCRSLQILLVEDVALNQELNCAILEAKGHSVDVVGNGSEAIMAVADRTYDLVLMDLQMPYVDGIAATRAIRLLPGRCRFVAIVALTAAVLREQTDAALAAGMNGVLTKPLSLADLDAVLERASRDALRAAVDPAAFDPEVVDGLVRILGENRVRSMSALLETSLVTRFTLPLDETTELALRTEAHASIAGAAMLGFTRFGQLCRAFSQADAASLASCHEALLDELYQVARTLQDGADHGQRPAPARLSA